MASNFENPFSGVSTKGTPFASWNYDPTDDNEAALAGINQIRDAYGNLKVPEYTPVDYQGPQEAADIRVDPAALERVGPSAYDQISSDPQYKAAQIAQLSALSELRDKGGMNLTDKANLLQLQQEAANNAKSLRSAVMQNAQMRGMGGSNQTLMNQLNANQQAQTIGSNEAMRTAGMAQDRALQAGNSAAGLAGQMGTTDFNQQAQVAAARDNAAKFNAQMSNANSQFNVNSQFNQQAANQRKSQGVNDATAMAGNNSQTMNRYTMPNAKFGNAATKAGGLANAGKAQTDYYGAQSAAQQRAQGGLLGGLVQGAGAAMSMVGGKKGGSDAGNGMNQGGGNTSQPSWGASDGANYDTGSDYAPLNTDSSEYEKSGLMQNQGFAQGGMVPGQAPVPGDSAQNDVVPAALSPGEIVMPRSVTQDPNKQAQLNALMGIRNRGV